MAPSSFLSNPTIVRLPTLLNEVRTGELLVPKFQRPFVWKDDQRLLLLDSIQQGLPIGSLLVWRTTAHKMASYPSIGPFPAATAPPAGVRSYLIDGHQRVSTLYGALQTAPALPLETDVSETDDDDDDDGRIRWPIYFDLEANAFCLLPLGRREAPAKWLSAAALFDGEQLYEAVRKLRDNGYKLEAKRAEQLSEQFKDYQIPLVPIHSEDATKVLESFRRVNSQGTKMSELLMIRAMSWSEEYDLLQILEKILEENLAPLGWGKLDPQDLLDALKVVCNLSVYKTDQKQISLLVKDGKRMLRFEKSLAAAVRFLGESCGVIGPELLPFKYQLACLAAGADENGGKLPAAKDKQERLSRWFWQTTYLEYFSGIVDRPIREAAERVRGIVRGEKFSERDQVKVPPLPHRFRSQSARGVALILLFWRQLHSVKGIGTSDGVLRRIAMGDSSIVQKIVSPSELDNRTPSDGPENRWLVMSGREDAIRKLLMDGKPASPAFFQRQFLSQEAVAAYQRKNFANFLRLRREAIEEAEKKFLLQHNMIYETPNTAVLHSSR